MDFDPDSPLNRAHTRERQGEDHAKAERFDSATHCFNQAIGQPPPAPHPPDLILILFSPVHLRDVLNLTTSSKAREAIAAQISRIEGQILLTHKKRELLIQRLRDQARKQSTVTKPPAVRMTSVSFSAIFRLHVPVYYGSDR